MARFIKDRSEIKGQVPGSLILVGNQKMQHPIIRMMQYDANNLVEEELQSVGEGIERIRPGEVTWINIYGIHDVAMIRSVGEMLSLPALLLESIMNTDQRPRYENGDTYDAFLLKMLHFDRDEERLEAEQITIILGEHYVLTLQEREGDVFNPLRERIRKVKGKVRLNKNDYLAYALMDIIVDNYSVLVEKIGAKVEDMEDQIFNSKHIDTVEDLYNYKTEINYLRKAVRPMRDFMPHLLKAEDSYFTPENKEYLRDLVEMVEHTTEALELYNTLISDQLNIYNANLSNRMNEVMKVLTIFASIFIPLSFFAGIYGMNFEYMPELRYRIAYPLFWAGVVAVISTLLIYFKRKRWL